jgi:hypothetical protein
MHIGLVLRPFVLRPFVLRGSFFLFEPTLPIYTTSSFAPYRFSV